MIKNQKSILTVFHSFLYRYICEEQTVPQMREGVDRVLGAQQ